MTNRKNIKLPADLFNALKDDKGKHKSWPVYLEEQCLLDSDDSQQPVTLEATEYKNIADVIEDRLHER